MWKWKCICRYVNVIFDVTVHVFANNNGNENVSVNLNEDEYLCAYVHADVQGYVYESVCVCRNLQNMHIHTSR